MLFSSGQKQIVATQKPKCDVLFNPNAPAHLPTIQEQKRSMQTHASIKDTSILERLKTTGMAQIAQPAERVAETIVFALQQEKGVALNEIVIRPTAQPL